jgi:hypothetical protein
MQRLKLSHDVRLGPALVQMAATVMSEVPSPTTTFVGPMAGSPSQTATAPV